jgi:hypothetical protein
VIRKKTGPEVPFSTVFNWVSAQAQSGFVADAAGVSASKKLHRASKATADHAAMLAEPDKFCPR